MPESLFQSRCRPQACKFIKTETLAQVFSCEICEFFKNIFFYRTSLMAASAVKKNSVNWILSFFDI